MNSKNDSRTEAKRRIQLISESDRADFSRRINDAIWDVPEIASCRVLLLYASMPGEVSTDEIAWEARQRGIVTTFPRCFPDDRSMSLHHVSDGSDLRSANYGIREPIESCPNIDIGDIEVALLPGIAWDRQGNRLGRGAGYYDRLLARDGWNATTWGLFFAAQELARVPVEPWDRKLDGIVTEREAVRLTTSRPEPRS